MICFECDSLCMENEYFEHHVIPKCLGGKKTIILCPKCHNLIHGFEEDLNVKKLTKEVLRRKKENKERYTFHVPYGYKISIENKNMIEECPDEMKMIGKVVEYFKKGKNSNWIALRISKEGFKTRVGTDFQAAQIDRILKEKGLYKSKRSNWKKKLLKEIEVIMKEKNISFKEAWIICYNNAKGE